MTITDLPDLADAVLGYHINAGTVALVTTGADIAAAVLTPEPDPAGLYAAIPGVTSIQILTHDHDADSLDPWTSALRDYGGHQVRPPAIGPTIHLRADACKRPADQDWQPRSHHPVLARLGHVAASARDVVARLTMQLDDERPDPALAATTRQLATPAASLPPARQAALMQTAVRALATDRTLWATPMPFAGHDIHVPTLIGSLSIHPPAARALNADVIAHRADVGLVVDLARTAAPDHAPALTQAAALGVAVHGTDTIGPISNHVAATWLTSVPSPTPVTAAIADAAHTPTNLRSLAPPLTAATRPTTPPALSHHNQATTIWHENTPRSPGA